MQNAERVNDLLAEAEAKIPGLHHLPGGAVVFGSAAIAMRDRDLGRPVQDLDLFVSEVAFEGLRHLGVVVPDKPWAIAVSETLEILKSFPGVEHAAVVAAASPTAQSRGLLVGSLDDLRTWKRTQGRPKDLADLEHM